MKKLFNPAFIDLIYLTLNDIITTSIETETNPNIGENDGEIDWEG